MANHGRRYLIVAILANLLISNLVFASDTLLVQAGGAAGAGAGETGKPKLVDLWRPGDNGQRMNIKGRVTAIDGTPIAGASIYIRQADGNGSYHDERYRTVLTSDQKGRYQFGSVVPGQYYGVKHVHVTVYHDDFRSLDTEIYFKGDPNLSDDSLPNAVFLEEAKVKGETIMFGRFDIMLAPN